MKTTHLFIFATVLLLLTTLTQGCDKPQGLNIEKGKICFTGEDGSTQCVPLDENHAVVMEKSGNSVKLSGRDAKTFFDSAQLKGQSESKALQSMLEESHKVLTFNSNNMQLNWKGDSILLISRSTGIIEQRIATNDAKGVLLFVGKGQDEVSLSLYAEEECTDEVDIDQLIKDECVSHPGICNLNLHVCAHKLLGKMGNVHGGLAIIVIDPAVIDPDWYIFRRDALDPDFKVLPGMQNKLNTPSIFLELPQTQSLHTSEAYFQGASIAKFVSEPDPIVKDDCEWDVDAKKDTLCKMSGPVQIIECAGVITFTSGDVVQTYDSHLCNLTIQRNPSDESVTILCDAACSASFGDARCK